MWVLEARENAEVVWFPVVWEEVKDASNVIDYNINWEQTKDTFATINANNQTTTGMAIVIPWVNAPKLIAETSIVWSLWWWGWTLKATARANFSRDYDWYDTYNTYLKTFTITDESWTEKITQTADWLKIPSDWLYMLDMQYKWIVWEMDCTDNLVVNWNIVHSFVGGWSQYWPHDPTEQLFLSFNKWDIISIYLETRHTTSSYYTFDHYVIIKFNKVN